MFEFGRPVKQLPSAKAYTIMDNNGVFLNRADSERFPVIMEEFQVCHHVLASDSLEKRGLQVQLRDQAPLGLPYRTPRPMVEPEDLPLLSMGKFCGLAAASCRGVYSRNHSSFVAE